MGQFDTRTDIQIARDRISELQKKVIRLERECDEANARADSYLARILGRWVRRRRPRNTDGTVREPLGNEGVGDGTDTRRDGPAPKPPEGEAREPMKKPKRVSVKQLCASAGASEDEIEGIIDELNEAIPPEVKAEYGDDYKLVSLHVDEKTGERYVLLHAEVGIA